MLYYLSARLFQGASFLHRTAYKYGLFPSYKASIPVISIGNMTMGGTGKTPFVLYVAQLLTSQGFRVAVLSRGYKGKASQKGGLVSDGMRLFLSSKESGDEPYLLAKNLKNIPIFVGKNRWKESKKARDFFKPDILLLDDAHQHFKLASKISILLIDCLDPFGGGKHYPEGRLRESLNGVNRADLVVLTHVAGMSDKDKQEIIKKLRGLGYKRSIHEVNFVPHKIIRGDEKVSFEPRELRNKKVFVFTAIANPHKFLNTLRELHVQVLGHIFFRDHHQFSERDMQNIYHLAQSKKVDMILTTEKDSVRVEKDKELYHYLKINLKFNSSEEHFFSEIKKFL